MKLRLGAAGLCVVAAAAVSVGAAAVPVTVGSAHSSALGVRIVVSASGRTLYHDSAEANGAVRCTSACAKQWQPLLVAAGSKLVAGAGVSAALLGTVKRPEGGKLQVTYRRMPLYLYAGDTKVGESTGQGSTSFGGTWYAVASSGAVVTKIPSGSSSPTQSSGGTGSAGTSTGSSGSGSSGSGSSGYSGSTVTVPCGADPNSAPCE